MKTFKSSVCCAVAALVLGFAPQSGYSQQRTVILSTTTSTQDSGLLDVLAPLFEKQSGYSVKTVSVGTGQALALAAKGDADVALVHAPSLEKRYVAEGKLLNRRLVMYNDFVIIGPKNDPAKVRLTKSAAGALKTIEQAKATFVSRGDDSGTDVLEKSLWKAAGIEPKGSWYIEAGQGMAQRWALPTSAMRTPLRIVAPISPTENA
jgi:tungstate transport system substrate-binding protein